MKRSNFWKISINEGLVLIFRTALVIVMVLILVNCSENDTNATLQFLNKIGISGIDQPNVIQSSSFPLVNTDYKNKAYYLLISMKRSHYETFIKTNGFEKEVVLNLPVKGGQGPKIPAWWDPPETQNELFSKKVGNVSVILMWRNGQVLLFASD